MAQCMSAEASPVFLTYLLANPSPLVLVASKTSSASANAFFASAMKPSTSALRKYWNTPETMMSVGRVAYTYSRIDGASTPGYITAS